MAKLTLNEKDGVPTGEYGTVYRMEGFNVIPEKAPLTRPKLRSGPDFEIEYTGRKLSEDVLDPITGEVLYEAGTELTPEILEDMSNHLLEWVNIDDPTGNNHNPTGIANPADYISEIAFGKEKERDMTRRDRRNREERARLYGEGE